MSAPTLPLLFGRELRLLSILPRCARTSIQALLREAVDDRHARVDTVAVVSENSNELLNRHLQHA